MMLIRLQTWVVHPSDLGLALEPTSDLKCRLRSVLNTERERLETLNEDEAIRGAQAATEVTQPFDTSTDDEGCRAKRLAVAQAVIAWARLGEVREITVRPVELTRVDHCTTHRRTITAEVLRQRVDHDVSTMIDGAAEHRCQRIIYGEGEAVSMSNISNSGDIDEVKLGVAQRLSVDELGIGLDSCLEVLRVLGIDEGRRDTEAGQRNAQEIVRTAVDAGGGDDMITSTQQGKNRRSDSAHATCRSDGTDTTFESCQALLKDVGRGVIEAGIEVGRDLQVKDPSGVVSTIKSEGICLIKRNCSRAAVCSGIESVVEGQSRYVLAHCLRRCLWGE